MDYQTFFNKSDYFVLDALLGNECRSPFDSLTVKEIMENTELSHVKVRNALKGFIMAGIVSEGTKDGNSKTFFITSKGIDYYKEVLKCTDENIAELVINTKKANKEREANKLKESNNEK